MAMKRFGKIPALLASSAIAAAPGIASACAMCGLSPGDHAGHAYNTSVLFMLAGPYLTFGLIGGLIFYLWHRAKRIERIEAELSVAKR
jgi:hypothetical protein